MPVDYIILGKRIKELRNKLGLSQEKLAERANLSRENINRFENASKYPGVDALVQIANALHVSVDDLLADSLKYLASTADSDLHRLLIGCNKIEEEIITKNAQELKKILVEHGV